MRSRYLISAAVLVAAACIGRRREAPAAPDPGPMRAPQDPPAPIPAPEPVAAAPGEPVVADEAVAAAHEPSPVEEPAVAERGSFAIGGRALAPGHAVVSGITFASRLDGPVAAELLRLRVERALNVPDGGLVVLADAGFAPDAEGFTLALAAAAAGRFAAAGTYEVLAVPSSAPTGGSTR